MRNIIICITILIIGFIAGRLSIGESETKYVKGDTIRDTLLVDNPYDVYIPANPVLPLKPDTINNEVYLKVDTLQIIANYIKRNSYKNLLFDDLNGKLVVSSVVQYNQLENLSYEFTPIQKQTTIIKKRLLTPYISSSYNSFGIVGIGGGLYYHDVGLGAKYITDFERKGFEVGLNIKF